MFNREMINIINHLYVEQPLADQKKKEILHCYDDRVIPLTQRGVVTEVSEKWELSPGVIGLLTMAEESLENFPPKNWLFGSPLRDPLAEPTPKMACFVAMPYRPSWSPSVRNLLKQAIKDSGYEFDIADVSKPGVIMHQVWRSIRSAHVIIADLTGLNANVLYEVGMAHALGKEVILVTQNPEELPFDVKGLRWIPYGFSNLRDLEKKLKDSLAELSKELSLAMT